MTTWVGTATAKWRKVNHTHMWSILSKVNNVDIYRNISRIVVKTWSNQDYLENCSDFFIPWNYWTFIDVYITSLNKRTKIVVSVSQIRFQQWCIPMFKIQKSQIVLLWVQTLFVKVRTSASLPLPPCLPRYYLSTEYIERAYYCGCAYARALLGIRSQQWIEVTLVIQCSSLFYISSITDRPHVYYHWVIFIYF